MHEIAAMQGAVSDVLTALKQSGGRRVTHVYLTLGASGHLTEAAARQHFALLSQGTPVADASLVITWLPASYQCFSCLNHFESLAPADAVACPQCGGVALETGHQDICWVDAIEIDSGGDGEPADTVALALASQGTGK
jgi:Zn finger protein HypA/HybF involved in hydrogenase expression